MDRARCGTPRAHRRHRHRPCRLARFGRRRSRAGRRRRMAAVHARRVARSRPAAPRRRTSSSRSRTRAPAPVDLAGLEVVYATSSGSTVTRKATWAASTMLEPGRRVLIANAAGSLRADRRPDLHGRVRGDRRGGGAAGRRRDRDRRRRLGRRDERVRRGDGGRGPARRFEPRAGAGRCRRERHGTRTTTRPTGSCRARRRRRGWLRLPSRARVPRRVRRPCRRCHRRRSRRSRRRRRPVSSPSPVPVGDTDRGAHRDPGAHPERHADPDASPRRRHRLLPRSRSRPPGPCPTTST